MSAFGTKRCDRAANWRIEPRAMRKLGAAIIAAGFASSTPAAFSVSAASTSSISISKTIRPTFCRARNDRIRAAAVLIALIVLPNLAGGRRRFGIAYGAGARAGLRAQPQPL